MTAEQGNDSREPEIVRVGEQSGKPILIDYELDVPELKINAKHQKRKSRNIKYSSDVHHHPADVVQLTSEIHLLFGVDGIEYEEYDRQMYQEYEVQKSVAEDIDEHRYE